jgi:hypothetical protein
MKGVARTVTIVAALLTAYVVVQLGAVMLGAVLGFLAYRAKPQPQLRYVEVSATAAGSAPSPRQGAEKH